MFLGPRHYGLGCPVFSVTLTNLNQKPAGHYDDITVQVQQNTFRPVKLYVFFVEHYGFGYVLGSIEFNFR